MRAANFLFNFVTIIFVVLALVVAAFTLAIAGDVLEPPFLLPPTDVPTPTLVPDIGEELPTPFLPTFTPSNTPEPTETPEPTLTPTLTETPTPEQPVATEAPPTDTPAPTEPPPEETPEVTPESGADEPPGEFPDDAVGSAALAALPSFTPLAPVPSRTPAPTITLTPGPRPTNTVTPTPPGPLPPTLSPYPFLVQPGTPLLRDSFADGTTGCEWQGVAGTVVDQRGEAVVGVEVRVRSASGEQTALAGTDTDYGPSGWEVRLSGAPRAEQVTVALWADDQPVSPAVEVVFPATCTQNLALINFVQTRAF